MAQVYGGMPGPQSTRAQVYNSVRLNGEGVKYLPGGRIIDASAARDPDNTGYITTLRPGLVMGRVTATGLFAPSILGLTTVLHDTSVVTTTMTLPAKIVTEIARRIGASGTFKITGPPTTAGTVVTETVTYSAIASATTITITATSADFAIGSVIRPVDGSETPLCFIDDGDGIRVTDIDGNDVDQPFPFALIGGTLNTDNIINYSSDASVKAWLKGQLNNASNYGFVFNDAFQL